MTELAKRIVDLNIDEYVISNEQINAVREMMGVNQESTEQELREARNKIVIAFKGATDEAMKIGVDEWIKVQAGLSGAVCAIDDLLFHKGYAV